jgi:tetratricopeptide (TPR) repeat protein
LRKATELDPELADAHYTLGMTLWQQGESVTAENELRAAIRAKPDYAEAYYTLGTVLKQQEKWQDAAAALQETIRLQPYLAGAHTTLAAVLRAMGDAQGATEESRKGALLAKESTDMQAAVFATNSGKRLMNAGDLDGAISQFRAAVASTPGYAPAHYQLGLALQRKGNAEESGREFKKAAELGAQPKAEPQPKPNPVPKAEPQEKPSPE